MSKCLNEAHFCQFSPSLLSGLTGVKLGPGSGGAGGGPGTSSRSGPPRQRPLQEAKGASQGTARFFANLADRHDNDHLASVFASSPPVLAQLYRSCLQTRARWLPP